MISAEALLTVLYLVAIVGFGYFCLGQGIFGRAFSERPVLARIGRRLHRPDHRARR